MRSLRQATAGSAAMLLIGVAFIGGCATHRPDLTSTFVRSGDPKINFDAPAPPQDSFETALSQLRRLSEQARPRPKLESGQSAERTDPRLAEALAALGTEPSADQYRRVAEEYRRAGILDVAYEYFNRALRVEPKDAAAYDGRARIWRDWGFPHLGLGDAHRAIYHARQSPAPYNTLGTLFERMGRRSDARAAYEQALQRDSGAAYALHNLCDIPVAERQRLAAESACAVALQVNAALARRRNAESTGAPDTWPRQVTTYVEGRYDGGIQHLTHHRFGEALAAFEEAARYDVALHARVRQALDALGGGQ